MNVRFSITTDSTKEIDDLIARFDQARNAGPANLEDYLVASDHPGFSAQLTELARIDMEYRYDANEPCRAAMYFTKYPNAFTELEYRKALAFEEYRLRRRCGENIEPNDVAGQYDLEGVGWPNVKLGVDAESRNRSHSRVLSTRDVRTRSVSYPRTGGSFAGYQLVERLGEGAFSRVFLARQPDLANDSWL